MKTPRGIRNNNPGNIVRTKDKWKGLRTVQTDTRFCEFTEMKWGVRALVKILLRYYRVYKLDTVRKIISKYAPPFENNTEGYVQHVAKNLGIHADGRLAMDQNMMEALVVAIIRQECGTSIDNSIVWEGIRLGWQ